MKSNIIFKNDKYNGGGESNFIHFVDYPKEPYVQDRLIKYNNERDNIYINVKIVPQNPQSLDNTLLSYTSTKNTPLVNNANEYYMSILSFDLPLLDLPITLMPIVPNQTNPNLSSLVIGIRYLNVDYPVNLTFIPQENLNIYPAPNQNQPNQVITPYYFIYCYQWFLNMVNIALSKALLNSGVHAILVANNIIDPYFTYNSVTQLIDLIIPSCFKTKTGFLPNLPQIRINQLFYQYLDTFAWVEDGNVSSQLNVYLDIANSNLHDYDGYSLYGVAPSNPPEYYILTQCSSLIAYWSPIRKIIFKTNLLPIQKEYVQTPNNLNELQPIITDFTPRITNSSDGRSLVYYIPNAQYRLIDILDPNPIYSININIEWADIQGNTYPMYIPSFTETSLKLGFFRKSIYKNLI